MGTALRVVVLCWCLLRGIMACFWLWAGTSLLLHRGCSKSLLCWRLWTETLKLSALKCPRKVESPARWTALLLTSEGFLCHPEPRAAVRMWTAGYQSLVLITSTERSHIPTWKDKALGRDIVASEIPAARMDTGPGQPFQSWWVKRHHKLWASSHRQHPRPCAAGQVRAGTAALGPGSGHGHGESGLWAQWLITCCISGLAPWSKRPLSY